TVHVPALLPDDREPSGAVVDRARSGLDERGADLLLQLIGDVGVLFQIGLRVLAALADARIAVRVPRPALADEVELQTDVDERTGLADALAVHDVEVGHTERRRDLVLHDFDPRAIA